jgi:hypothetical protein
MLVMEHYMKTKFLFLIWIVLLAAFPALAQEATDEPEATPEATETAPCFVGTDAVKSVPVRVGPGTNRTSFIFLPAGELFTVLGKAEADDGSLWWKLDREIVAPKKSAAEAWVSQEDVLTRGDCEAVIDVNAPPIIPIANGSQSSGTTTSSIGLPAAEDEVLPQAGTWTLVYPGSVTGTCPQGNAPATLELDWPDESWPLTVPGGTSITYATRAFTRTGEGVYSGVTTLTRLGSAVTARMTLRVRSSSQITADFAFSLPVKGVTCSFTVSASMTVD